MQERGGISLLENGDGRKKGKEGKLAANWAAPAEEA
jgi:hypothetical protein